MQADGASSPTDQAPLPRRRHYDVSGADGQPGRNGSNGSSHGGSSGQRGYDGGAATEGTEGQKGGHLHLRLFDPEGFGRAARGVLGVSGQLFMADGRVESVDDRLGVTPNTEVFGDAHGGDGGRGGDGGHGGCGARGSSGSDATRYSEAGDGGRGGAGGSGGPAADGRNPGPGGDVRFEVDSRDTDLAVVIRRNVCAGIPGQAGTPGTGGSGGRGGSGGSGTSWTETYTAYEDGKSVTKTRIRSRGPGSSGRSGSTGSTNSKRVHDGLEQPPGTFTVAVSQSTGKPDQEYHEIFDLELLDFVIESRNVDGVFEPDEEILVTNLQLRNRQGEHRMPTPPGSLIKVFYKQEDYLEGSSDEFELTESLAPGQEKIFAGPLVVKIRDVRDEEIPAVGDAWGADQVMNPAAVLESVHHEFEQFEAPQTIHVRFPLEVTPISSAHSMARGERKKVFWKVRNVSSRAFGSRAELKREIETLIRREGGSLAEEEFAFYTPAGAKLQLDATGFTEMVDHLPPYSGTPDTEALIEGHLEIGEKAPFYEEAEIHLDLSLGRIGEPTSRRRIQGRARTVRVAQAYHKTAGSDLLLVTNSSSTRPEVEAWRELAESFGMELDVWDLSYNKRFDLSDEASREGLVEDFAGKTVIVLNNEFEVAVGHNADSRKVVADELINRADFQRAVADQVVNFLLVGNAARGGADVLRELLSPVAVEPGAGNENCWRSPKLFLTDLRVQASDADDTSGRRDVTRYIDRSTRVFVEKKRYWFAFKPRARHLDAIARDTLAWVDRIFPTRRYRVTPRFLAEPRKRLWWSLWILREYDLGELELTRSLDRTLQDGSGTVAALDARDHMHLSEVVKSTPMFAALFSALKLRQKLDVFAHLYGHDGRRLEAAWRLEAGEALIDTILADLAVEQAAMRSYWSGGFSKRRLRVRMENLRRLAEDHSFGVPARPGSEEAGLMVRLIAGIEHMARSQRLWRDCFYRAQGLLLPLVIVGVLVYIGMQQLAIYGIDLVRQTPEMMGDVVTLPGLPYAFDPAIYYFLPALAAPLVSLLSLVVITRRNAQVSSVTAAWARHLNRRLFSRNNGHRDTWKQVMERVKTLRDAVTAALGAKSSNRRHESMRQMQGPLDSVTTDDELNLDPDERFLTAEELDGARAKSVIHAQAKTALEAEMQAASEALEAPSDNAKRFVRRW